MLKQNFKTMTEKSKFTRKVKIEKQSVMQTLHGTSQFSALKGKRRVVWSLLMIYNVIVTIVFLFIIKKRFKSDQTVTKMYSDWMVDTVPFPAVSICNFNMVSLNESRSIEKILQKDKIPQQEIESFFHDLSYLTSYGWGSDKVSSHLEVMKVLKQHYYSVNTIMEEVHQKCENLLVYCEFNGSEKKCSDLFTLVRTTVGYCCTFNFEGIDSEDDEFIVSVDEDLENYYDLNSNSRTNIIATSQSGRSSGLRVVFNVEPQDYPTWSTAFAYGAKILLSDPRDYVETKVLHKYMMAGESVGLKVEPLIFQTEEAVRSVPVAKRGCWFYDEVKLSLTNKYSYDTCNVECKIMNFKTFCGCVPYKYPADRFSRVCEFSDLECLHYMKVHWETVKQECIPACLEECRDMEYTISDDIVPFLSQSYPKSITEGRNVNDLAGLHVYYLKSTCNCYMMNLLTDTNTFIATYGGIFSVAFGVSVITIFELVYLSIASLGKIICRFPLINDFKKRWN